MNVHSQEGHERITVPEVASQEGHDKGIGRQIAYSLQSLAPLHLIAEPSVSYRVAKVLLDLCIERVKSLALL